MAFGRGTSDRTQGDRGARLDAGVLRRDAAHVGRTAASRPKKVRITSNEEDATDEQIIDELAGFTFEIGVDTGNRYEKVIQFELVRMNP
jgi:hypothetical protein